MPHAFTSTATATGPPLGKLLPARPAMQPPALTRCWAAWSMCCRWAVWRHRAELTCRASGCSVGYECLAGLHDLPSACLRSLLAHPLLWPPPCPTPPQTLGPYCAALCAAEVFSSLLKPSHTAHSSQDYAYAQLSKGRGGKPAAVGRRGGGGADGEDVAWEEEGAAATPRPPKPYAMRMSGEQQAMRAFTSVHSSLHLHRAISLLFRCCA